MDRFTELINKGVAAFNYDAIASDGSIYDHPVCREYNNIFSIASDTHMSPYEDGFIITGSIFKHNDREINSFMYNTQYKGIQFIHPRHHDRTSLAQWINFHDLQGHIGTVNGDKVYILKPRTEGGEANEYPKFAVTYTTSESDIPQSTRFLSVNGDLGDLTECLADNVYDTCKNMNKSRNVRGTNWIPVYETDGIHLSCSINNVIVRL